MTSKYVYLTEKELLVTAEAVSASILWYGKHGEPTDAGFDNLCRVYSKLADELERIKEEKEDF